MSEWVRLTTENTERRPYDPWFIDCPNCGRGGITPSGGSSTTTRKCFACGKEIEFAVRVSEK